MTNVAFNCAGWTDPDGILSYTFYKSKDSETQKSLIGTTPNSTAFYTLSEGIYNIFAAATDNFGATSASIFVQQITVTPTKIYQHLNNNETKTLSEIDGILDSFLNGSLIDDVFENENLLSIKENLPKSVMAFLEWNLANKNATAEEIMNAIKTTLGNELFEYSNGLTRDEILAIINKKLNQINDKKADILAEVLKDISKTQINSTSDLIKMLQTTSSALQKSKSFTINDATLTSGIVLYARIDNSGSDMVLINGYINAKNNTVYLEGDFRVAKFLRKNGLDNFNVNAKYNKMSADVYLNDEDETTIDIETGKYQMFPVSSMIGVSFFGETTVSINFKTYQHHFITAWNISIDQSLSTYGTDQKIKNATFTTFLPLSKDQTFLTFPILTNTTIKNFMAGKPLNIGESKLSFNILKTDSAKTFATMEITSGKLLFKKSNATISLWITDFEWINADSLSTKTGYDWKAFIPETLKMENISVDFIQKLIPGTNMQISVEGDGELPAILITGFEDEKELEIAYDFRWLLFSSLTLDGTWKSINEFKEFFRQGFAANVLSGTVSFILKFKLKIEAEDL
uniref:Uncharacterized protein n=1 Tax=Panagrolaimus sp. ES5 TaxID=591445 RepID=A0AC34FK17_9BILA